MSRFFLTFLIPAVVAASAVVDAAAEPAKRDKCYIHPLDFQRQCAKELGGYCFPEDGIWWVDGSIKGTPRFETCIAQKRAQKK